MSIIRNQVFVGLPWKTVKAKYERIIDDMKKKYPISYVIVGRDDNQSADDLLVQIKRKMNSSSYAIFDATNGNPNVSLEYGYSEAKNIERAIYICNHGRQAKKKEGSIISDLAGKKRNTYKTETALKVLLGKNAKNHPYTVRYEMELKKIKSSMTKGKKTRFSPLARKIVHQLDNVEKKKYDEIVSFKENHNHYTISEIKECIKQLCGHRLLESKKIRNVKYLKIK
jgi:hypothetical protein